MTKNSTTNENLSAFLTPIHNVRIAQLNDGTWQVVMPWEKLSDPYLSIGDYSITIHELPDNFQFDKIRPLGVSPPNEYGTIVLRYKSPHNPHYTSACQAWADPLRNDDSDE